MISQTYPLWVCEAPERGDLWDLTLDEILTAFARSTYRVIGWVEAPGDFSNWAYASPVIVNHGPSPLVARVLIEQEQPVFYAETRRDAVQAAYVNLKPPGTRRLAVPSAHDGPGSTWRTSLDKALG